MGGFTLIEVLITIFVVAFGILGTINLIAVVAKNTLESRDQIIAMELAQEGLELVRNIRDTNILKEKSDVFSEGFPNLSDHPCTIDKDSDRLENCNNNINKKKIYYHSNGFYTHNDTGTETKFKRKIVLKYYNDDGNETNNLHETVKVEVESRVYWQAADPSDCTIKNKCYAVKGTLIQY